MAGNRMTITGDGRVGIGVTAPQSDLHLRSGGFTYLSVDAELNNDAIIQLRDGSAGNPDAQWTMRRDGDDAGKLQWRHDNLKRMTLTSAGFLGIGTDNPTERLHVQGAMRVTDLSGTGDRNVIVDSQGKFKIGTLGSGDTDWVENATEVYNNTHNIGIGTSAPSTKLTILGNENDGTTAALRIGTPGTPPFFSDWNAMLLDGNEIDVVHATLGESSLDLQENSAGNVTLVKGGGKVGIGMEPSSKLTILGPDNDGIVAGLEIRSIGGEQVMLIDGNEIDALTGNLHLNANSGRPMSIGTLQVANGYALTVKGKVMAEEMRVQLQANWPDYVFAGDYDLMPLKELANYIDTHSHLPNIPSARIAEDQGIELGEMNRRLLEKVEELTLYILQQQREIDELRELIVPK